jgi:uncharacterized protein (TIGR02001 family)
MNKVVLSVVTALAVSAAVPAFAADMPVKAKSVVPVAAPSPWDVAFGTAFTTDYVLRGISQSDRQGAVQGYAEGRYTINDMVTLYAGVWGSSLTTYIADAEFDFSGGARFTYGNFGLDVGYVYYAYPGGRLPAPNFFYDDFGEFYAKPSFKVNDWLSVGGSVIGGDNYNNAGTWAMYYTLNGTVTLPISLPYGIATSVSAEVGWQTFEVGTDYTTWNIGIAFNYKAITLDLRYYDTDLDGTTAVLSPTGRTLSNEAFVATLKFDTTLSALK